MGVKTVPYRAKSFVGSPFVIFSILMTIKLFMVWFVIYGDFSWRPLTTGLPSVWVAFGLIELLGAKRRLTGYMIVNLLLTCIYFAVIMYYKYFGIIVTYHALAQVGQVTEVKGSVFQLMHPYFLLIYIDILAVAVLLICTKKLRSWGRNASGFPYRRAAGAVLLAAALGICLLNVLPNLGIVNELKRAEAMGIVNYEVEMILTSGGGTGIDPKSVTNAAIREAKGLTPPPANPVYWKAAAGRNVIYVQLEAFQNFLLGLHVGGKEITPNLNKLMEEGVYFPHFYQQVGSGNTSDAEFTTNTSLYVPANSAAADTYTGKVLPGLPRLFQDIGYTSVTFHTNDVAFWNRKNLYAALGFSKYYDSSYFKDEDLVHFGSSDEVLYRKTAEEMERLKNAGTSFYANVISMSGHHPFNLPERKNKIELPERFHDTFVGDYLRSQNYADYALGQFVGELKQRGLWDNSLLVIYGDHMGVPIYSMTKTDRTLMEEMTGASYDYTRMLNIPLILMAPGALQPQQVSVVGGQSDIMPTVANLAGISIEQTPHFGQDLLNTASNLLPERYYLPSGSFINGSAIFIPGRGYKDGQAIPLAGTETAGRQAPTEDEFRRALKLLDMSNAYTEGLPDRR
jgi:lipoteichoic acid synthase